MRRADVRTAIRSEREELVADLRAIPEAAWDKPSLCDGWLVRDIVGHLVRIDEMYRRGLPALFDFVRSGFRLNRAIADGGRRRAANRSPESLARDLAETAYERRLGPKLYPWPQVPLAELIVHGQDIRRPLGLERKFDTDRLASVAAVLTTPIRYPWGRGSRYGGVHFEATDADWVRGDGPLVRGPLEAIVMVLAGRRAALANLEGEGIAILGGNA